MPWYDRLDLGIRMRQQQYCRCVTEQRTRTAAAMHGLLFDVWGVMHICLNCTEQIRSAESDGSILQGQKRTSRYRFKRPLHLQPTTRLHTHIQNKRICFPRLVQATRVHLRRVAKETTVAHLQEQGKWTGATTRGLEGEHASVGTSNYNRRSLALFACSFYVCLCIHVHLKCR